MGLGARNYLVEQDFVKDGQGVNWGKKGCLNKLFNKAHSYLTPKTRREKGSGPLITRWHGVVKEGWADLDLVEALNTYGTSHVHEFPLSAKKITARG